MKIFADRARHIVCQPYSIENLHLMAEQLNIKRCWFHNSSYAHYDIPKTRQKEILSRPDVKVISSKEILRICKS